MDSQQQQDWTHINKMESQQYPMKPLNPASKASYGPAIIAPPRIQATKETSSNHTSAPSNLGFKLAGDAVIGTGVTLLMAPVLTVIDKAIAQRAAGTHTLAQSGLQTLQSMAGRPAAFARNPAFLYVWAVYASTYTTANSLKTLAEHHEQTRSKDFSAQDQNRAALGSMGIFLGTSFANSGASVLKDRAFAYMFSPESGSTTIARKVPKASYGLWMSRDLIGVGSSFILPDLIARKLSYSNPETMKRNRDIAQLCVPVATQVVAGPLHLLGLDLFNRPMQEMPLKHRVMERVAFLSNGFSAIVGARVARIIPGYGFGGVLNTNLRDGWRDYLRDQEATGSYLQLPLATSLGNLDTTLRTNSLELLSS